MTTNAERQAARIMVSGAARLLGNALMHLLSVYFHYLTDWAPRLVARIYARLPDRQRLLKGHSALAVMFSFGFGMVSGVNICVAAVVVARAAVGTG